MVQPVGGTGGSLALVGAGEFLEVMVPVDRMLLARLPAGGLRQPLVAILATASVNDPPGTFERWGAMGKAHFERLGARVVVSGIRQPADAHDAQQVALLEGCDLYYFSGGLPEILIEVFAGSPAWESIRRANRAGAVVAGCSAGAMAIGPATLAIRDFFQGKPPHWIAALGLEPRLCTLPHFDRMLDFMGADQLEAAVAGAPPGSLVVGIDEQVALIGRGDVWEVAGRDARGVTLLERDGGRRSFLTGERVRLTAAGMEQRW